MNFDWPAWPAALTWPTFLDRLAPAGSPEAGGWVWIALAASVVALAVPTLWLRLRLIVTLSHELGHAAIGMLAGRRFRGFVVNRDMSGHAVTSGRPSGLGLVLSTWAGYPAPALLGAALVQAAVSGWAATALGAIAVLLLLTLVFARTWGTAGLVLLAGAAAAAAAWWLPAQVAAGLVLGSGVFLLLGAWRHLFTVMRSGGRRDDPGALASATHVPAWFWLGTFVLAIGACSWWAGTRLVEIVAAVLPAA